MIDERTEDIVQLRDKYASINPRPIPPWQEEAFKLDNKPDSYTEALELCLKRWLDLEIVYAVTKPELVKKYLEDCREWEKGFNEWSRF